MFGGCLHLPTESGGEAVDALFTTSDCARDPSGSQLQVWAHRSNPDLLSSFVPRDHLVDPAPCTSGRVIYECPSVKAFPHRRPRRDHDQVARLEAAGLVVEVAETGGRAGDLRGAAGERLELVDLVVEDLADLAEVDGAFLVGYLEEEALGLLDHLRWLAVALGDGL